MKEDGKREGFHGRGFFPHGMTLGDAFARLAAVEAVLVY